MLLGAWPVGGKNGPAPNNKNGKCRFLLLCGGYTVFLILGAAMFSAIEAPKIDDITKRVEDFRNQFLERNGCLNGYINFDSWLEAKIYLNKTEHAVGKCGFLFMCNHIDVVTSIVLLPMSLRKHLQVFRN